MWRIPVMFWLDGSQHVMYVWFIGLHSNLNDAFFHWLTVRVRVFDVSLILIGENWWEAVWLVNCFHWLTVAGRLHDWLGYLPSRRTASQRHPGHHGGFQPGYLGDSCGSHHHCGTHCLLPGISGLLGSSEDEHLFTVSGELLKQGLFIHHAVLLRLVGKSNWIP